MFNRIWLISRVTLLEALRQRALNILLIFGLVIIGAANFFSQFSFEEQTRFVKDFAFGAMTMIGVLVSVTAVAQLLPYEKENRTLMTILSKPVRRFEFLLGKFFGVVWLLLLVLVIMGLVFKGVLELQEKQWKDSLEVLKQSQISAEDQAEAQFKFEKFKAETKNSLLMIALALVGARWLLMAAIAFVISTFATSMLFTVVTSLLIYIMGHLQGLARTMANDPAVQMNDFSRFFFNGISFLLPDFQRFNVIDTVLFQMQVNGGQLLGLLGYVGVYVAVLLTVACLIFSTREL